MAEFQRWLVSVGLRVVFLVVFGTMAATVSWAQAPDYNVNVPMDAGTAIPPIGSWLTSPQGSIGMGQQESWHEVGATGEPTHQNGWSGAVAFRKTPTGLVVIKGTVAGGTVGVGVFTLPAGYRPGEILTLATATANANGAGGTYGTLVIYPNGDVYALVGHPDWFSVSTVFFAEQ